MLDDFHLRVVLVWIYRCLVGALDTGFLYNHIRAFFYENRWLKWVIELQFVYSNIIFAQHYYKWFIIHHPSLAWKWFVFFSLNCAEPIYRNDLCNHTSSNAHRWWFLIFLLYYIYMLRIILDQYLDSVIITGRWSAGTLFAFKAGITSFKLANSSLS